MKDKCSCCGSELDVQGFYQSYGGPHGLSIKIPFYGTRHNPQKAHMSNRPLGHQVLVDFLGTLIWINVRPSDLIAM